MQILAAIGLFHNLREAKMQLTIGELEDILLELKMAGALKDFALGKGLKRNTELFPWTERDRCICTVGFRYTEAQMEKVGDWNVVRGIALFGCGLRSEELVRYWLRELLNRSLIAPKVNREHPAIMQLRQKLGDEPSSREKQASTEYTGLFSWLRIWLVVLSGRRYKYRRAGRHGRKRARQELVRRWFSSRKRRRRMDPGDKAMIWGTIIAGSLVALYRFLTTILA